MLFCLLVCNTAFAQAPKSMYDGEKRIYYTDMDDAKNKLIEYHKERGGDYFQFPFNMFKDLILHDKRSLSFKFSFDQIDEIYSQNNDVKIYSWNTGNGGAIRNFDYDGAFTYLVGNDYFAISPTYEDEYHEVINEKKYNNIIPLWMRPSKIYTIKSSNYEKIFYIDFFYRTYGYIESLYAIKINEDGIITPEPIFESDNNCFPTIEHHILDGWNNFKSSIYSINDTIYRPIPYQPVETQDWCFPHSSGRVDVWKFDGTIFKYSGVQYDKTEIVHSMLRNYKANIVTITLKPYTIRIDLMPNGTYRYSSWKNKEMSEKPDLVINSGVRMSPIEGEKGFKSLKEQYIFQNNGYFYIISYEMVIYNGFYECAMPMLVVKRNDKTLMEIKAK